MTASLKPEDDATRLITLEDIMVEHAAIAFNDRTRARFDRPMTVPEILTRDDGVWADVCMAERLRYAMSPNVLSTQARVRLCADVAEQVLTWERKAGREPPAVLWEALRVVRLSIAAMPPQDICEQEMRDALCNAAAYASSASPGPGSDAAWGVVLCGNGGWTSLEQAVSYVRRILSVENGERERMRQAARLLKIIGVEGPCHSAS